jgi:hypothetical protein
VLIEFTLNGGDSTMTAGSLVVLTHRVVGTAPTHYRVAERADFQGVSWATYETPLRWAGSPTSGACENRTGIRLTLFLQVRVMLGEEVRIVQGRRTMVPVTVESNVLADSICVVQPRLATGR